MDATFHIRLEARNPAKGTLTGLPYQCRSGSVRWWTIAVTYGRIGCWTNDSLCSPGCDGGRRACSPLSAPALVRAPMDGRPYEIRSARWRSSLVRHNLRVKFMYCLFAQDKHTMRLWR